MEVVEINLPIPVSDNRRLIPVRIGGKNRMITSPELREYKKLVGPIFLRQWRNALVKRENGSKSILQRFGDQTIIVPSKSHQLHIQVKAYVPNWRSDVSNYTKTLKDFMTGVIYDDDKFVHIDYLDSEEDKQNPRLTVWIPLDTYAFATPNIQFEDDDEGCTCSRRRMLELGYHYWETPHHPECPKYKPLIIRLSHGKPRGHRKQVVGPTKDT